MIETNGHSQTYTQADWTDFAHTGPGTLAGRYLRTFWQPVYRAQDVKPGQAKPIRVMSEDLTLYRGQSGTAHVLGFRCAHRGTQLSTGWVEGDELRCRYHGWMYDGSGQCVQQPAEPEPFYEKVRIRSYPTQEYLGLIFVYMGDGEAPPMPHFPEMEGDGEIQADLSYRACNYFNNVENSLDPVHSYFTHWNRRRPLLEQAFPVCSGEETEYGILRREERPNGDVRLVHFYMPNIHHLGESAEYQSIRWRVPVDDTVHMIPVAIFGQRTLNDSDANERPEEDPVESSRRMTEVGEIILAGKMTLDDIEDRGSQGNVEDYVTQVGQGIIADRHVEILGRSDTALVLLRKTWERELRALAEGKPLKQWSRREALVSSSWER